MRNIKEKVKQKLPSCVWTFLIFFKNLPKTTKILLYRLILLLSGNRIFFAVLNSIFRKTNLEIRKFSPLNDYINNNIGDCEVLNKRNIEYSFAIPHFWTHKNSSEIRKISIEHCYDVNLRDVQIIGNSNLLLVGANSAIYELKYHDKSSNFKYTDGGIEVYSTKFVLVKFSKSARVFEKGIKLTANYSWNYYHLIYEVLSKFYYIQKSAIPQNIPLLVDKVVMDVPQFKELLDIFNSSNREIIPIEKGERCFVNELYSFPDAQIGPPNYLSIENVLSSDNKTDLNSLRFIRETLIKHSAEGNFPKRIFLSRKNASKRRDYNEEEVFNILELYGFKKIFPENYTIAEQVTLFNGADYIVGTTGAAFSNILFCNPSCRLLCFTNYNIPFSTFSTIAYYAKVELIYMFDKTLKYNHESNLHSAFIVDAKVLGDFLIEYWNL